jgi:diaminohydroxyphosphoribosylaminopyrimidine deaminase/5-amino-6-(5-phosphoribosylamino)uracil reductase
MSHKDYMNLAFKLAKRGNGLVSPNPLVGAVLIKNGKLIGKGYHRKYGANHAEVDAIRTAKEDVSGSTLYCNLEPCCHLKKQTPPCVPLIIQKKIKRVVISNIDPNKEVNGKGIKQLREAGIEVVMGVLENKGKELNKFYFKRIKENNPYITLKIAQSVDGKIGLSKQKQTWLTGKESIKYVHTLRSEYDAVLVGAGTIKSDNPLLTVREVSRRNPYKIIIDGRLTSPLQSKIFKDDAEKTWIFTSSKSDIYKRKKLIDIGVKIFALNPAKNGVLRLKKILSILKEYKINSVLVEGGAEIFTQFVKSDLYDEIVILQAPIILGEGINSLQIAKNKKLQLLQIKRLGEDIKLVFGKKFSN